MAPWIRVGYKMADLYEVTLLEYVPGVPSVLRKDDFYQKPKLLLFFRNGTNDVLEFSTEESGSSTFEQLFALLMPDIAEQLKRERNGSGDDPELSGGGVPPDLDPQAEVLAGDPLGVYDTPGVQQERFVFTGDPRGEAGRIDG